MSLSTKSIALIAVGVLLVGGAGGWCLNGWRLGEQIEEMKAEQATALATAEKVARETEQKWQATTAQLRTQYEKEKQDAESRINDLRTSVADGSVRLSVATAGGQSGGNAGNGASKTRAELDRAVAGALVGIANDGDDAIRALNMCIDQYNAVKGGK